MTSEIVPFILEVRNRCQGSGGLPAAGAHELQPPMALSGRHNAPQQTGTRPTGEGHRGVHPLLGLEPQVLRGLVFGNKASFCYANATLTSLLWMHSEAGIQLDPASPDLRLALQKVIQSAKRIGHLWSCVLWRRAIHPWPNRRSRIPADPLPRDVQ